MNNLVILGGESKTLDFSEKIAEKIGFKNLYTKKRNEEDLINSTGVPTLSLMKKAGEIIFDKQGIYPDLVIFLNLHAFRRKSQEIDQAISLIKLTSSDSVVSVNKERKPVFKYGDYGLKIINEGRLSDVSLQREMLFSFEGSIYYLGDFIE